MAHLRGEITMPAYSYDITIERGAAFDFVFIVKDKDTGLALDLTGYGVLMKVRKTIDDASVILEISTANGGAVVTGAQGKVTMHVDASDTLELGVDYGVYDVFLIPATGADYQTRYLEGSVSLPMVVSRA